MAFHVIMVHSSCGHPTVLDSRLDITWTNFRRVSSWRCPSGSVGPHEASSRPDGRWATDGGPPKRSKLRSLGCLLGSREDALDASCHPGSGSLAQLPSRFEIDIGKHFLRKDLPWSDGG